MSELLDKKLDKNYGKVQKKELKYQESSDKVLSSYDKKLKALAATLKDESKKQNDVEKDIKAEHKTVLKNVKDTYKEQSSVITTKIKDVKKVYSEDIEKADEKFLKSSTKINGLIEKANNDAEKLNEKVLKEYNKDVESCEKEKASIEEKFAKDTEKTTEKFNDKKAKYEEKVASLNEKRDAKTAKLNEQSQKKIEKLNADIESQRAKTDKTLAENLPVYEEKIADIAQQSADEKADYDEKAGNINKALEEKLVRRNKFLEQAENQGDTKAAKLQRKEIKQLELNADRELKILKSAHDDRNKDLTAKGKEIDKNNFEQIAALEREFANFKEDALMQIELNKVELADAITNVKLDTDLKLKDELNKFNQVEAKNEIELGELVKEKDLALNEQEDALKKLEIEFDKTNEINAQKLVEELALRQKELEIAQFTKDTEYNLAQIKHDASMAKLDAEQEVLDRQLTQDILVNEENELLRLYRNDYDRQASIRVEFFESQKEHVVSMQERAKELLEYEELEAENRFSLKVAFLEEQKALVEQDYKNIVERIENAFAQENAYFTNEINKLSEKDLKALDKFIEGKEKEIEEISEKKVDLDPKADHRRIKELNDEITGVRNEITNETNRVNAEIAEKTKVYESNLALATARKDKALEEAKETFDFENNDLNHAIELLNQNKESELLEAKARYGKTLQNYNNFENNATAKDALTTNENTKYLNDREDHENAIIANAKQTFEDLRNQINTAKDQKLSDLEAAKKATQEKLQADTLDQEKQFEAKANEVNSNIQKSESKALSRLNERATIHGNAIAKIQKVQNDLVASVENNLRTKDNLYKEAVAQIDKKADVEKKNYEEEQKRVQKEYDIELKKSIMTINRKLEADIKSL